MGSKFQNNVTPNQVKDATDEDFENIFQRAAFFQTLLKNFLEVTRSWSRYVKDAFDSGLCNRKKIRNVRHTNPILSTEMSDSCVFFNIQNLASKSDLKILWKSSFFARFFFGTPLKNFSWVQHGCSRYLEGVFYLQVYVEKRMKVIQHIDQNIFGKNSPQKLVFGGWQSQ